MPDTDLTPWQLYYYVLNKFLQIGDDSIIQIICNYLNDYIGAKYWTFTSRSLMMISNKTQNVHYLLNAGNTNSVKFGWINYTFLPLSRVFIDLHLQKVLTSKITSNTYVVIGIFMSDFDQTQTLGTDIKGLSIGWCYDETTNESYFIHKNDKQQIQNLKMNSDELIRVGINSAENMFVIITKDLNGNKYCNIFNIDMFGVRFGVNSVVKNCCLGIGLMS